jgi:hypothetical protein
MRPAGLSAAICGDLLLAASSARTQEPQAAQATVTTQSAGVITGRLKGESSSPDATVTGKQETSKTTGDTIVGVKILKANREVSGQPLKILIPSDCPGCTVMHGPFYEGQNARESFFYLKVPVSLRVVKGISVDVGDLDVRAVVVEKSYLAFHRNGHGKALRRTSGSKIRYFELES